MGFEPTTTGITIRDSDQLSYAHHDSKTLGVAGYYTRDETAYSTLKMARPTGIEPVTTSLEGWCSIR